MTIGRFSFWICWSAVGWVSSKSAVVDSEQGELQDTPVGTEFRFIGDSDIFRSGEDEQLDSAISAASSLATVEPVGGKLHRRLMRSLQTVEGGKENTLELAQAESHDSKEVDDDKKASVTAAAISAAQDATRDAMAEGKRADEVGLRALYAARAAGGSQADCLEASVNAAIQAATDGGGSSLHVGKVAASAAQRAGGTMKDVVSAATVASMEAALRAGDTPAVVGKVSTAAALEAGGSRADAMLAAAHGAARAVADAGGKPLEAGKAAKEATRAAGGTAQQLITAAGYGASLAARKVHRSAAEVAKEQQTAEDIARVDLEATEEEARAELEDRAEEAREEREERETETERLRVRALMEAREAAQLKLQQRKQKKAASLRKKQAHALARLWHDYGGRREHHEISEPAWNEPMTAQGRLQQAQVAETQTDAKLSLETEPANHQEQAMSVDQEEQDADVAETVVEDEAQSDSRDMDEPLEENQRGSHLLRRSDPGQFNFDLERPQFDLPSDTPVLRAHQPHTSQIIRDTDEPLQENQRGSHLRRGNPGASLERPQFDLPSDTPVPRAHQPRTSQITRHGRRDQHEADAIKEYRKDTDRSHPSHPLHLQSYVKTSEQRTHCPGWAYLGYCRQERYAAFMMTNCAHVCGGQSNVASDTMQSLMRDSGEATHCLGWAYLGYCAGNRYEAYMETNCKQTCAIKFGGAKPQTFQLDAPDASNIDLRHPDDHRIVAEELPAPQHISLSSRKPWADHRPVETAAFEARSNGHTVERGTSTRETVGGLCWDCPDSMPSADSVPSADAAAIQDGGTAPPLSDWGLRRVDSSKEHLRVLPPPVPLQQAAETAMGQHGSQARHPVPPPRHQSARRSPFMRGPQPPKFMMPPVAPNLVAKGQCSDTEGFGMVLDEVQCQAAAEYFGSTYRGSGSWPWMPHGCSRSAHNVIKFNRNSESTHSCGDEFACICDKVISWYSVVKNGVCDDWPGRFVVATLEDCKAAALRQGLEWRGSGNFSHLPKGCVNGLNEGVHFNDMQSDRQCGDNGQECLCSDARVLLQPEERAPSQWMTLLADDLATSEDFEITFGIKPHAIVDVWTNILRITTSDTDHGNYGDMMPAFFFHPGSTRLRAAMGRQDQFDAGCDVSGNDMPLGEVSTVVARLVGNTFAVYVNGVQGCVVPGYVWKYPPESKARVWLGDAFNTAAHCELSSFVYRVQVGTDQPPRSLPVSGRILLQMGNATDFAAAASAKQAVVNLVASIGDVPESAIAVSMRTEGVGSLVSGDDRSDLSKPAPVYVHYDIAPVEEVSGEHVMAAINQRSLANLTAVLNSELFKLDTFFTTSVASSSAREATAIDSLTISTSDKTSSRITASRSNVSTSAGNGSRSAQGT